jgi:MFS transporter, putative metabolite:H+ symporter
MSAVPFESIRQQASASQRLDRLPVTAFHYRLLVLIGAGLFLDAFEIYLGGGVLGALLKQGWSTLDQNAMFVSMTFAGMVIGAWTSGILGDRFGRRFSYQVNLAIFGFASLLAVVAPNMQVLIGLRFVMGIGLGAELAILTEFLPPRQRGKLVALLAAFTNSAVFVASLLGLWVIPNLGWRYMFAIVGVLALGIWFMRKSMPESPRWLESKGRHEEAAEVLRHIEQQCAMQPASAAASDASAVPVKREHFLALFKPDLIGRTLLGVVIIVVINFTLYGFVGWLPSFFVKQGYSIVSSLQWTTVISLGGPVGGLIGYVFADKIGRKRAIVSAACVAAAFGLVYPYVGPGYPLLAAGFFLVTAIYVIVIFGQAIYISELFPTHLRMRGSALCSTSGRLVGIAVPVIVVAIFNWGGVNAVVSTIAALLVIAIALLAMFGVETRNKTLEEIAPVTLD